MRVNKWYLYFKTIPSIGPRFRPIWAPWARMSCNPTNTTSIISTLLATFSCMWTLCRTNAHTLLLSYTKIKKESDAVDSIRANFFLSAAQFFVFFNIFLHLFPFFLQFASWNLLPGFAYFHMFLHFLCFFFKDKIVTCSFNFFFATMILYRLWPGGKGH